MDTVKLASIIVVGISIAGFFLYLWDTGRLWNLGSTVGSGIDKIKGAAGIQNEQKFTFKGWTDEAFKDLPKEGGK